MALLAVSVVFRPPGATASAPAGELYDVCPDWSRAVLDWVHGHYRGSGNQVVPPSRVGHGGTDNHGVVPFAWEYRRCYNYTPHMRVVICSLKTKEGKPYAFLPVHRIARSF